MLRDCSEFTASVQSDDQNLKYAFYIINTYFYGKDEHITVLDSLGLVNLTLETMYGSMMVPTSVGFNRFDCATEVNTLGDGFT